MRREGKQHGTVRCYDLESYPNLLKQTRVVNRFDAVPTRKGFTKVSSKPTNHSKPTTDIGFGCSCCQDTPASKARAKAKRAHKGRSKDVLLNYRLAAFRLVGPTNGILDVLNEHRSPAHDHDYEDEYDEDEDEIEVEARVGGQVCFAISNDYEDGAELNIIEDGGADKGVGEEVKGNGGDDLEYYCVGVAVCESEEEEEEDDDDKDWCIVVEDM